MAKAKTGKKRDSSTGKTKKRSSEVENILDQADALKLYLEKGSTDSVKQLMAFMDTLKDAIISLTQGDLEKAAGSMKRLNVIAAADLFLGIGEITRDLHDSIQDIQNFLEPIFANITEADIQGLSTKLTHVSSLVKDTSERTLDLLFSRQEVALADNMAFDAVARLIVSYDKKDALIKLKGLKFHNSELVNELMRISELQIHADLVDQIIKKVSRVVDNMEQRLVELIRRYGHHHPVQHGAAGKDRLGLHGPAIPGERKGVASSQDEVDDLLRSFNL